jgi:proline iminopeptidase
VDFAVFSSPPVPGADPIVAINGGMLFGHDMLWPALAPLATRRQIVLYDQRGRGASSPPVDPDSATIEDDAADVGALRRALGIRRWSVVGHSWGGGIAMLAADLDRAGTARLVTIDGVGATSEWMPILRANALQRLNDSSRIHLERIAESALTVPDPTVHWAQARAMYPAWFVDPSLASRFTLPQTHSPTGAAVLARLRRERYDWRSRLRSIDAPTLVIHGDADPLPISVAEELASTIPTATLRRISGSGHMPFWEAPEQLFPVIEAFL